MAARRAKRTFVTPAALRDIRELLKWGRKTFGAAAAGRYRALLQQAFRDIEADPRRPGSVACPELRSDARMYHLSLSRTRVPPPRVGAPRHFILYRSTADGSIEIGRILRDGVDLVRHVPEEYRRVGGDA